MDNAAYRNWNPALFPQRPLEMKMGEGEQYSAAREVKVSSDTFIEPN